MTKEKKFWYEDDNIIPISGYQWILMKMFGLHLDSIHDPNIKYEVIGKDTSVVVPDLNEDSRLRIGRNPQSEDPAKGYLPITEDIPATHFIQGFLVGNGGAGEDAITTKNTETQYLSSRRLLMILWTHLLQESISVFSVIVLIQRHTTSRNLMNVHTSTTTGGEMVRDGITLIL